MAVRTTRWSPDTCPCIVEFSWDDSVSADARTHSYHDTVQTCPEHGALAGSALFDTVFSENRRKNVTLFLAQQIEASITGEDFLWLFDSERVLEVNFGERLTAVQKQELQAACNIQFGPGLVRVV